jgi:hypothetical protein
VIEHFVQHKRLVQKPSDALAEKLALDGRILLACQNDHRDLLGK